MQQFKPGDQVFPRWSQYLPSFMVVQAGPIMVKIVDEWGNTELMHHKDLVLV
jgi:hypothetical protein